MRWTILCIGVCFLSISRGDARAADPCGTCHQVSVEGAHARLACLPCHGPEGGKIPFAGAGDGNRLCLRCHGRYAAIFDREMSTREKEIRFADRTFGKAAPEFFGKNCASCHVTSCMDCHGKQAHKVRRPGSEACLECHKGYFVGPEYFGRAPREENLRYQRGKTFQGETYLKMLPDVHARAGMTCASCHSMKSLAAGEKASRRCVDCHRPGKGVIEHAIASHMTRMECYACHSAWAAQEYGTFIVRFSETPSVKYFRLARNDGEYVKSAYLKMQDAPPLGVNRAGKVSPIRPEFIVFFSDIRKGVPQGAENRLLAAEWKAFFPHTVRRGTVSCEGCHGNARRFLLESPKDRIYDLRSDGLALPSFRDRAGQRVVNGNFVENAVVTRMSTGNRLYWRAYIEKWKRLIDRVEDSSGP